MRKLVTVLLMVLMLWTPVRMASASGDGGGIVILNTVSAFTKPTTFVTIVLLSYAIVVNLFGPQILTLPPALRARAILALTAEFTATFFQYVFANSIRYFLFALTFPQFYYERSPSANPATPEQAQEGLWTASNPDVKAQAAPVDPEKDKQDLINKAVQAALRDPELAKNYLDYATPDVKAAVTKALADRHRF